MSWSFSNLSKHLLKIFYRLAYFSKGFFWSETYWFEMQTIKQQELVCVHFSIWALRWYQKNKVTSGEGAKMFARRMYSSLPSECILFSVFMYPSAYETLLHGSGCKTSWQRSETSQRATVWLAINNSWSWNKVLGIRCVSVSTVDSADISDFCNSVWRDNYSHTHRSISKFILRRRLNSLWLIGDVITHKKRTDE